ncbi:unnamed protein product [Caenorhabditis sp. 36 PRJEB53466]|nr:unnamed protein product [Caenorhabditis sp. 36 PRJEB53466]
MPSSVQVLKSSENVLKENDKIVRNIAQFCRTLNRKFEDPEFPAGNQSIGVVYHRQPDGEYRLDLPENVAWFRPENIVTSGLMDHLLEWDSWRDPHPSQVHQGILGDCWLIATFKSLCAQKELFEKILPKRQEFAELGIYQVRLCVDGEWKMFIVDDFFPCSSERRELYAHCTHKMLWVLILEKAFAKMTGNYGRLHGGLSKFAFEVFTGAVTIVRDDLETKSAKEQDELWKEMAESYAQGFMMTASSPTDVALREKYDDVGLAQDHSYSVLGVTYHNEYRLVKIGNTHKSKGWNGKCSDWGKHKDKELSKETLMKLGLWTKGDFTMALEDFCQWFKHLTICMYREGYEEFRFNQVLDTNDEVNSKVLRVNVDKRCKVCVDFKVTEPSDLKFLFFINIHHVTPDDHVGELVQTACVEGCELSTEPIHLEPGAYFVLFVPNSSLTIYGLRWVIRSETPIDCSFVRLNYTKMTCDALQQMVLKEGRVEEKRDDGVIIRTFFNKRIVVMMAENNRKWHHIRFKVDASESKNLRKFGAVDDDYWSLPPKARRIMAFLQQEDDKEEPKAHLTVDYSFLYFTALPFCRSLIYPEPDDHFYQTTPITN